MLLELKMRILKAFGFQYKAAQALGIRDDELSAILHKRKILNAELIVMLADLLNISNDELLEIIKRDESSMNGGKNEK